MATTSKTSDGDISEDFSSVADALHAEYVRQSEDNFELFVRGLVIPAADGERVLDDVVQPFQMDFFREVGRSMSSLRDGRKAKVRRYWVERTKGAGKDSDLSLCLLYLLAFPKRPLYIQVGAADRDQAGIVRRRMEDVVRFNPWLLDRVAIGKYKVCSIPGRYVELDILSADVAGSHGETPDVLVINELSHVTKWEFVENLLDNASKVSNGVVVVATNAGFKGTKAEMLRKHAKSILGGWKFHVWDRPAPWIAKENIEEARRMDQPSRYNRLWWGKWSSGKGDALDEDGIDWCLSRCDGPTMSPEKGWQYVAGLDLGVSHDHAAIVVVGANPHERRMKVALVRGWKPNPKTREVDLIEVEDAVVSASKTYKLRCTYYDPTEARLLAQQMRRRGIAMREVSFASPKNRDMMACALVQVVNQKILEAYDDGDGRLRRDFGKLSIVENKTGKGYKLEATSDEYGHADAGVALAIALPGAIDVLAGRVGLQEDDTLVDLSDSPLTDDDLSSMPADMRAIYDCD